jgi:hypothetical protein
MQLSPGAAICQDEEAVLIELFRVLIVPDGLWKASWLGRAGVLIRRERVVLQGSQ